MPPPESIVSRPNHVSYPPLRKLTPYEQKLVLDNIGIAEKQASDAAYALMKRRYSHSFNRDLKDQLFEEFVDAGWVGLVIAAQRYDPSHGQAGFCTFAWWTVRGQIARAFDVCEIRQRGNRGSIKDRIRNFSEIEIGWDHEYCDPGITIPDSRENEFSGEPSPELQCLLSLILDKRSLKIIRARIFEEKSLHEIGVVEGVSRERIRQLEMKALNKLKKHKTFVAALSHMAERAKKVNSWELNAAVQIA